MVDPGQDLGLAFIEEKLRDFLHRPALARQPLVEHEVGGGEPTLAEEAAHAIPPGEKIAGAMQPAEDAAHRAVRGQVQMADVRTA